jgi:ribosomal protein S18 acetylase RimI-like enzyme
MWLQRELSDRTEILRRLETDRWYSAYAIGDLEPWFFRQCRWWLAENASGEWAVMLLYAGLQPPALFCLGMTDGVGALLDGTDLPEALYFAARPESWLEMERRYDMCFARIMFRMVLDRGCFRAVDHPDVFRLEKRDLQTVEALFALGAPGDADGFSPYQVEQGVFFGRRVEGQLVSVAGTHLVSPIYRLAALGNVFTHPGHRGRGHATACTAAVTSELARRGLDVVLNVAGSNAVALHLYERLGFRTHCRFVEGIGARRASAGGPSRSESA